MATYYIENPPALDTTNPQTFLSYVGDYGSIARGNRYFVTMQIPNVLRGGDISEINNDLTYLCDTAELPGRSFNVVNYRYYGPTKLMPYQSEFNNIQLSFIVRNEMLEKQYFDNWFEAMNPASSYDMKYKVDYQTTIDIFKMVDYDDGISSAKYKLTLEEAFPVTMDSIPLAWGDESFVKLNITFHYSRYLRKGYDQEAVGFSLVDTGSITRDGTVLPNVLAGDFRRDGSGFRN